MTDNEHKGIIEAAFPPTTWPLIVKMARDTYSHIDNLTTQDLHWLNGVQGRTTVGMMRSVLIEHNLKLVLENLAAPSYRCEYVPNATESHHHLEIYTKDAVATVCKVRKRSKPPTDTAKYRLGLSASNQMILDLFTDQPIVIPSEENRTYIGITHGKNRFGKLDFVCVGIPDRDLRSWLYRIDLLQQAADVPKDQLVETEKIVEETFIKLKTGGLEDVMRHHGT